MANIFKSEKGRSIVYVPITALERPDEVKALASLPSDLVKGRVENDVIAISDAVDALTFVHRRLVDKAEPEFPYMQKCAGVSCNGSVRPILEFKGRKECARCRNKQAEKRNADKAADSSLGLRICTGCKSARPPSAFKDTSTCDRCLAKGARHDAKPSRREYHNELNKERKYWQPYRARRSENLGEAEYKAHNAAVHKKWYNANKEHVRIYTKSTPSVVIANIKKSFRQNSVDVEVSDDVLLDLIRADCSYCGKVAAPGDFNCVNRLDFRDCVREGNITASCYACVMMKGCLDPVTFVERCGHIAAVHEKSATAAKNDDAFVDNATSVPFKLYAERAARKRLAFEFSEEKFAELRSNPCSFCDRSAANMGVDRYDDDVGYTAGNAVPCCGECNFLKRGMHGDLFVRHCGKVADNAKPEIRNAAVPRNMRNIDV